MTDTLPRRLIRWGLYPASWAALAFGFHRILAWGEDPRAVWGQTTGALLLDYLLEEFTLRYQSRWSMNWTSFMADLKFSIANAGAVALISAGRAHFTITTASSHPGPGRNWPVAAQVVAALLIFEAINRSLHRAMHRVRDRVGAFLWRRHAAHQLPPRLYLVMYAVFHPLNVVLIQRLAIILPVWAMGHTPQAVAKFRMINGMRGFLDTSTSTSARAG